MSHCRFIAALAALALAAPALAHNTTEDIRASGGAILPSLGLAVDVAGDSTLLTHSRSSHAVALDYIAGRSHDKDRLRAGDDPVVFGGETFAAPQDLHYTSTIQFVDLVYRYRYWFGQSNFALDGMAGVGWASLGLKVRGDTQSAAERMSNGGIVIGVGGLWRFAPATALQVRILGLGTGSTEGVSSAGRFEVSVVHALGRHAQVRAGLGSVSAYSAREDDRDSDSLKSPIRASAGGLLLGFEALF